MCYFYKSITEDYGWMTYHELRYEELKSNKGSSASKGEVIL